MGTPSRLSDVFRLTRDLIETAADATPVKVGRAYLDRGVGCAPRVIFVPIGAGSAGAAPKAGAGYVAGITRACNVIVRGMPDGSDEGAQDDAERIADRVINLLRAIAPGRIELGAYTPDGLDDTDAHGADIAFGFRFTRPVREDKAIYRAAMTAMLPQSPMDPLRRNGGNGKTYEIQIATEATREG